MDYEDLVIQLAAGAAGGYTVRVARSPAGETDPQPLCLPVEPGEIERLARIFGDATRDLRPPAAAAVSEAALTDLGGRLFRSLLAGAIGKLYHRCMGRIADEGDRGLRIRIQMGLGIPAMLRLHAVPWEYLYDAETRHFLAFDAKTSIVRHLDLAMPPERLPAPAPLAILVVACQDAALDLARERQAIEQAWTGQGEIRFRRLLDPTLQAVREELRAGDCHVLHFMGHAGFDPAAGEGSLAFCDGAGQRVWHSGQEVADQLRGISSLRLVVLNACWTARTSSCGPYAGVATGLLNAGVPAVLAMQFPITDGAALAFSHAFYRRLARGDTLDAAVTDGRLAIRGDRRHSPEWGTPVLFERLTSGRVVEARLSPPPRPPHRRLRGTAAALLLAGGLVVAWLGWRACPANPAGPAPSAAAPLAPIAHGAGVKPRAAPGARLYKLSDGESILIRELATVVDAEFSGDRREPCLTLGLAPPRSPAAERHVVHGAASIGVPPGPAQLVILDVDCGGRAVRLSAEPTGPPAGASAQCFDGYYSFSRSHGGTCSSHGKVVRWL